MNGFEMSSVFAVASFVRNTYSAQDMRVGVAYFANNVIALTKSSCSDDVEREFVHIFVHFDFKLK
jgi:hypothetical protein